MNETLQKLGLFDFWPKSKDLPGWLRDERMPVLEWAISKDRKPKWPLALAFDDKAMAVVAVDVAAEPEPEPEQEQEQVAAPAEADRNPDRFAERFGNALEAATGGMMTVSRETQKVRKQVEMVPPLAVEAVIDDMDELAPAPAATA